MKVPFKQRSWGANMWLVFRLCLGNLVPLLLVSMALELPGFLIKYVSTGDPGFGPWSAGIFGMDALGGWLISNLLMTPIKQAFCLSIVARCYEGMPVPVMGGIRGVVRSVPRLVFFAVTTTIAVALAFAPGFLLEYITWNAFVFLVLSGVPLAWMFSGIIMGPSVIVVEGRGAVSALTESLQMAERRRRYLLSFLGLLYLPLFLLGYIWISIHMGTIRDEPLRIESLRSATSYLEWAGIMSLITLPSVIAPTVLYFQFKAKPDQVTPNDLAHLVDHIHDRHA